MKGFSGENLDLALFSLAMTNYQTKVDAIYLLTHK
jgi:hypothetical protein